MHHIQAVSTPIAAAHSTTRQEIRLLWAGVMLIAICYGLGRYAYGFFVPVFRVEFGVDGTVAGVIAAGSYIAYCLAITLSTILIPRFGARPVAVTAGSLATAGILVVAFAPNTALLTLGVLIAGSSTGVSSPPLAEAVARTVRVSRRDRTQTVINAATGFGVALSGPVALLTQEQWRSAWITFAVLSAAVTIYTAFTVPSAPQTVNGRRKNTGAAQQSRPALLPQPLFPQGSGRLVTAAALMGVASSAVWTFGRDVLVGVGGMSVVSSSIAWILLGVAGALGALTGDIAGRFGIAKVWLLTMLGLAVSTAILAVFPSITLVAWAATAAFGPIYMMLTGLLLIWGTNVYPATPAAGVGLAFLVMSLGQAAASPVIGGLLESINAPAGFAVASAAAVIGAFFGPRLHDMRRWREGSWASS